MPVIRGLIKMTFYIKNKRDKVGICNICLKEKKLSWDHVPPKGSVEITEVEIENIFNKITSSNNKRQYKLSQNGLKFRTICKKCNEKIGELYDPGINEFSKGVGSYLKSNLYLPPKIYYKAKPIKIIRGVLAHLLSAKIEVDEVNIDKTIRDFIFDLKKPIPTNLHVFYWTYPYENTEILRDFGMPRLRGQWGTYTLFNTIKFFPIAYLITDIPNYESLPELTVFNHLHSVLASY